MKTAPVFPLPGLALAAFLSLASPARAQTAPPPDGQPQATPPPLTIQERVEVVAGRIPETVGEVPRAVTVVTGEELESRGVSSLAGALALVPGVSIAPGGDGGPASSVPEFMGLREFDAFLLLVDGVPWGGAFNPALATLNLRDVERIEVLRGPAPVAYGSTSFVGVINVVHTSTGEPRVSASATLGSYASGGGSLSARLPEFGGWTSRVTVDGERRGYRDDRTSFVQGHVRWQGSKTLDSGRMWFAVDGALVNQEPASPHPREGKTLSTRVPVDANHNPDGAFFDDHRLSGYFGYERGTGRRVWSTTVSLSRGAQDMLRGFLMDVSDATDNARGYREQISLFDLYADSHWTWTFADGKRVVAGADYLHGNGSAKGAIFDYTAPLGGQPGPAATVPGSLDLKAEDHRDFVGTYVSAAWDVTPAFRLDAGVRLSVTAEVRDEGESASKPAGEEDLQTHVRPGGSVGFTWTPWRQQENRLRVFASYSNTFKPAAVDFGLGEGEVEGALKPETSQLVEGGVKSVFWRGRLSLEASAFLMDFNNLVVATTVGGVPGLTNAGQQRYRGFEASGHLVLPHHMALRANASYHDARFRDYVAEFDGVPTQLAGKRIEMSPHALAAMGLSYTPPTGLLASLETQFVGSRYLNKRNSALADGYGTVGGSIGYAFGKWDLRVVAANLTDTRPPVSESELGDAQYYLLPSRHIDVLFSVHY